jgi:branched-chain amino acid transport system ATP-binding protein
MPEQEQDGLALEVQDVSVRYGKFTAVETASFGLRLGELLALIGPNGHGKSSLVNAIAGLVSRGGVVRAFGAVLPPSDPAGAITAGIVLVPERRHLYPGLSVRDNVLLGGYIRARRLSAARAWAAVSDTLDLFPELAGRLNEKAGNLSGGQQQMVAIARAMAARPKVLLLDEPCLGLAESVGARVYELLVTLKEQGTGVLLVEENPLRALEICTRAVELYQGRSVEPDEVYAAVAKAGGAGAGRAREAQ